MPQKPFPPTAAGLLLLLLLAPLAAAQPAEGPLRLLRIQPSGEDVPPGSQVVFQFDRPVVPLGRMARDASEVPISITPDPGCEWRWLDRSALACQLAEERPLAPATR
ncbi:MAG: hypothetical protein R3325_08250 [Thermoanaerobaculia bacterium]|nr:hypothetical protein [Thermoanaerobaculia bacterium]